jgi:hypothetical protein
VNVSTLTISMIADQHDLTLDMPRDNTDGVPDWGNLGIDYGNDG